MSIELAMPSNNLILGHPLLLLPSIFPSLKIVTNESALCIRWPKYWSFSFSISPFNEYSRLISFRISLQSKGLSRVFSNTTVQKHQFFGAQLSLCRYTTIRVASSAYLRLLVFLPAVLIPACASSSPAFFFFLFYFLTLQYLLVLPYINMNPPQVYMCSPS